MNYSQTQLDQLDRLTGRWVADHIQKGKTSKKDKELVTLEMEHERERTARADGFGTLCCVHVPVESLNPEPANRPTTPR